MKPLRITRSCVALTMILFFLGSVTVIGTQPVSAASNSSIGMTLINVFHVTTTAGPTGDCSSWAKACTLQQALAAAGSGDEVWAAEGKYVPTGDRYTSFNIKGGVTVFGGFKGNETASNQRDWIDNSTILSGDIGMIGVAADNSYHVVTADGASANTILDGFTIQDGYGDAVNPPWQWGGGAYLVNSAMTIRNIVFRNNFAVGGGGMFIDGGSPKLLDVIFTDNKAEDGGGLHTFNNGSSQLINIVFSHNDVTDTCSCRGLGGGIANVNSNMTLIDVTLFDNTAQRYGGGMYIENAITNMTNLTFVDNAALLPLHGGGIYNTGNMPVITNSILWGNTPEQIFGSANATYSDIQGGYFGTGNIDGDPLLAPLGNYGGIGQTIAPLPGSPVIDAISSNCPFTDARGMPRSTTTCDMGAFESQGFTLTKASGDSQGAIINTAFAHPICVAVTARNANEPVDGGKISFTTPTGGASASLPSNTITISNGLGCTTAVANEISGSYNVIANGRGVAGTIFGLTNLIPIYLSLLFR